jgi:FkbM family methyltransferase
MTFEKLNEALGIVGRDAAAREEITRSLRSFEARTTYSGSLRDEVTGVIIDALYHDAGLLRKALKSGLIFEFQHTGRITRDFIMAREDTPDHVWEPQTTRLLLYLAKNAKHVVVGGAYIGDHVLMIAQQLAQRGGVCHAFEPGAENFKMLEHNVALNKLSAAVKAQPRGLWNEATKLTLIGDDALGSSAPVDDNDAITFETTTVDLYAAQQGISGQIGLLMLDTEGGELKALQGAQQHLQLPVGQAPHLVFEVHRHYVDWSDGLENTEIIQFLRSMGYSTFALRDFQSNYPMSHLPIEIIPAEDAYLEGPPHGFNMLAVKDESVLQNDLFKVCRHVSPKLLLHKDPALHHPLP